MNNKINYIFLGVIVILLCLSNFRQCSSDNKIQELYESQIKKNDSLVTMINQKIMLRKDTISVINKYLTERIIEVEKKKDEVQNTNDIDSLIAIYFRNRAIGY